MLPASHSLQNKAVKVNQAVFEPLNPSFPVECVEIYSNVRCVDPCNSNVTEPSLLQPVAEKKIDPFSLETVAYYMCRYIEFYEQ